MTNHVDGPTFLRVKRALAAVAVVVVVVAGGCETTPDRARGAVDDTRLPGWLQAPDLARDAGLEEAAALLCARDTDGVVDEEARHAARLVDGQVFGLWRRGANDEDARRALVADALSLLRSHRATHAGVVVGGAPSGGTCAALVGARRLVDVDGLPASALASGAPLILRVRIPDALKATLYTLKPDGFVTRQALPHAPDAQDIVVAPRAGDGRYVVELIVDVDTTLAGTAASDPEVALLWPYVVGAAREPPFPEVLFPDDGHDDTALTHRAEALVQRLRNEQLIDPFKIAPALLDVAAARARAVAARGTLGHRVVVEGAGAPTDVREDLALRAASDPRAQFLRVAEVQASASTLAEAWQALVDSPAHRYELVDTAFTHAGVAVARGSDPAGRATVTMVAVLGRRPPQRDPDATRVAILDAANDVRTRRGLEKLSESPHLNRLAMRLAGAMRDNKRVDDALLGGPIAKVALEADASLSRVKPLVARSDDPMLLLEGGPPGLLLDLDATQAGIGIALEPADGAFYVVVLAGE